MKCEVCQAGQVRGLRRRCIRGEEAEWCNMLLTHRLHLKHTPVKEAHFSHSFSGHSLQVPKKVANTAAGVSLQESSHLRQKERTRPQHFLHAQPHLPATVKGLQVPSGARPY